MLNGGIILKNKYTAQASTKEEAIQKALKALNINHDEAAIEVVEEGKKGFLGFGQKDAVVTVSNKENNQLLDEMDKITEPKGKSTAELTDSNTNNSSGLDDALSSGEESSDHGDPVTKKALGNVGSESIYRTSETQDVADSSQSNQIAQEREASQIDYKTKDTSTSAYDNFQEECENEPQEVVLSQQDEDGIQKVRTYLESILNRMQVEDAKVEVTVDLPRVHYDIETEDAGLVIGRHGKVLNGLQTLIQIQLHQHAEKKLFAKVDAEDYRKRRKDSVEQLASKTARRVLDTNQPVILEPMPAHERKQIHRLLHSYDKLKTHSEGKEPHRYLVVEKRIEN